MEAGSGRAGCSSRGSMRCPAGIHQDKGSERKSNGHIQDSRGAITRPWRWITCVGEMWGLCPELWVCGCGGGPGQGPWVGELESRGPRAQYRHTKLETSDTHSGDSVMNWQFVWVWSSEHGAGREAHWGSAGMELVLKFMWMDDFTEVESTERTATLRNSTTYGWMGREGGRGKSQQRILRKNLWDNSGSIRLGHHGRPEKRVWRRECRLHLVLLEGCWWGTMMSLACGSMGPWWLGQELFGPVVNSVGFIFRIQVLPICYDKYSIPGSCLITAASGILEF